MNMMPGSRAAAAERDRREAREPGPDPPIPAQNQATKRVY